eukprot:2948995-Karenia_brevis.AAC.1
MGSVDAFVTKKLTRTSRGKDGHLSYQGGCLTLAHAAQCCSLCTARKNNGAAHASAARASLHSAYS